MKSSKHALALVFVLLASDQTVLNAQNAISQGGPHENLIVQLQDGTTTSDLTALGMTVLDQIPGTSIFQICPPIGTAAQDAIDMLDAFDSVEYAELDITAFVPESGACGRSGPQVQIQHCTIGFVDGNPVPSKHQVDQWLRSVRLDAAQAVSNNHATIVAVIDTGVDLSHPVLAPQLLSVGYDFVTGLPGASKVLDGIDEDDDGLVDEAYGHGTHVAGIIVLANPAAMILPIRAVNSDGSGTAFALAKAIRFAQAEGVDVMNLSLSLSSFSQAVADALHHSVSTGVDVYTSAGNTDGAVLFPASLDVDDPTETGVPAIYPHGVIAVAALCDLNQKAVFSAYGPMVDVAGPGVEIYSCYPDGRYAWWSGTSMACAVVAGVGSIGCSNTPSGQGHRAAERLVDLARNVDAANPGYAGELGAGSANALRLVLDQQ